MADLAELAIRATATDDVSPAMESAAGSVEDFESTTGSAASFLDQHWMKIAAGAATASAAMEGFARTQAPLVESSARLGASIGEDAGAMRDLALQTSNVTFPLDDVYSLMETGRSQGLKAGGQLQEYATFWDTVGDATGESAVELGKSGAALRAVGVEAGNEGEAIAALGFIHQETSGNVSEFLNFIDRTGPELRKVGADVDDAAAVMGVLEHELGMTGRTARSEFRQALNESDGTLAGMLDTLGVSTEQFDKYRGVVDESSGVIQRNADIHAESYTPIQRLQHAASELMHRYSGLTKAAGTVAAGLAGVVPVVAQVVAAKRLGALVSQQTAATEVAANNATKTSMLSTVKAQAAARAARVKQWAVMAAKSLAHAAKVAAAWLISIGPIALVIAAVVGLVVLTVKNWDTIVRFTRKAWDWVGDKVEAVWNWIVDTTGGAVGAVVGFVTSMRDRAVAIVRALGDRFGALFSAIRDVAVAIWRQLKDTVVRVAIALKEELFAHVERLRRIGEIFGSIRDRVVEMMTGLRDEVVDRVMDLVDRVRGIKDTVIGFFRNAGSWLVSAGRNIISGLIDGIQATIGRAVDAVRDGVGRIRNMLPFSPAKDGPLSGRGAPDLAGAKLGQMIADGMRSQIPTVAAGASALAGAAMPGLGVPGVPRVGAIGSDGARAGGTVNNYEIHIESRGNVRDDLHAMKLALSR